MDKIKKKTKTNEFHTLADKVGNARVILAFNTQ